MTTFTKIVHSINWVDVVMLVLLIRIIFIGVKTGFITEGFKLFGIFCAVFVGLHYYTPLAAVLAKKTGLSIEGVECALFVLLISLVVIAVKYLRDGFFMIFKLETTHEGVNQWGAGVFAIIRALFLSSLIMFALLLTRIEWLHKETVTSISSKLALKVAPNTYGFLYHEFIGKIFAGERFNKEVSNTISRR